MPKLELKIGGEAKKILRIQCYLGNLDQFRGEEVFATAALNDVTFGVLVASGHTQKQAIFQSVRSTQSRCSVESTGGAKILVQHSFEGRAPYSVRGASAYSGFTESNLCCVRRSVQSAEAFSVDFWIFKCVLRYCACDKKVLEKM